VPRPANGAVAALSPAPHLATLRLDHVSPEEFTEFHRAVQRGFQGEVPDQVIEDDRELFELDRTFGFRVDGRWVSSFTAFTRKIVVPGGAWVAAAAVTAVTVTAPYRRRGLLAQMMRHQFEDSLRRDEPLAVLWASESVIYGRFGYGQAAPRLRLSGRTRSTAFLPEVDLGSGSVDEVTREQFLEVAPAIRDAASEGLAGTLDRPGRWREKVVYDPEHWRVGASALRFVLHFGPDGTPDGASTYRIKDDSDIHGPNSEVRIEEIDALNPHARARLWRYMLDLDLVRTFLCRNAAPDDPLRHLLAEPRAVHSELLDGLNLRILDIRSALSARRYATDIDVVITVRDDIVKANNGSFQLIGGPDGARVTRSRRKPDLSMNIRDLGTVYLGGTSISEMHSAGLVTEHRPGAVSTASAAFRAERDPFCADVF
jgi:predicted acetyltransferase